MASTIMLDAGHGGWHNGATFEGRAEKDDTLRLTLAVGDILEENGVNVLYTRTEDIYKSPGERAREANAAGVDYFVSIHRNSSPIPGHGWRRISTAIWRAWDLSIRESTKDRGLWC